MKGGNAASFGLFGIFGFPLGHTLSPAMQETAFRAAGIKAYYLPFEVTPGEFDRLMKGRRKMLLDGFNVTVPYKETVFRLLDRLSPEARAIGAVNTAVRRGNRWWGFNTDASGFLASLKREGKFNARGKNILILGAGGSARAVAYALGRAGARRIIIANRTPERAERIVKRFRNFFPKTKFVGTPISSSSHPSRFPTGEEVGGEGEGLIDLVVNATSIGLKPGDRLLVSPADFPNRKTLFMDLIYNPRETRFLRAARRSGHRTLNGLGMLVYQGAEAFRLWTGRRAPVDVMQKAVKAVLARQRSK